MAKVTAQLRDLNHRNDRVHTRWGHVEFDGNGRSSLEVDEDDLSMLSDMRWLLDPEEAVAFDRRVAETSARARDAADLALAERAADDVARSRAEADAKAAQEKAAAEAEHVAHVQREQEAEAARSKDDDVGGEDDEYEDVEGEDGEVDGAAPTDAGEKPAGEAKKTKRRKKRKQA